MLVSRGSRIGAFLKRFSVEEELLVLVMTLGVAAIVYVHIPFMTTHAALPLECIGGGNTSVLVTTEASLLVSLPEGLYFATIPQPLNGLEIGDETGRRGA